MLPNAPLLPLVGLIALLAAWLDSSKLRVGLGLLLAACSLGLLTRTTLWFPLAALVVTLPTLAAPRSWRLAWGGVAVLGLTLASVADGRRVHETHACQAQAPASSGQGQAIASLPHPGARISWMDTDSATVMLPESPAERNAGVPLEAWAESVDGWRIQLQEPAPASGSLTLRLEPSEGVRAVEVYLSPTGSFDAAQIALNLRRFPVDRAHQGALELRLDPQEILGAAWDSATEFSAIQVRFEGAPGTVLGGALADASQRFEPGVAQARLDFEGVIHPAWTMEPGSAIRHELEAQSGQRLRWSAAGGESEVRIGEMVMPLAATPTWRDQSLDLSPWAGQRVTVELAATDSAWAFIGNLRVERPAKDSLNVVIYLVDTLRADALGVYGAQWETPAYDAFAKQGARFALANSPSCWTKPSIPSLMSGIYPTTHRVGAQTLADRLPEQVPLIQERFTQAGWATASFASSPLGSTLSGLDRGFETAMPPTRWGLERSLGQTPSAQELHADLFAWWAQQDRPVFAYVHTLDVHQYYLKRTEQGTVEDRSWPAYAQSVQDSDPLFAEFMEQLRRSGHDKDTIVVLVSDHGESFWDHGLWSHGTGLAQSQIQIPMVIWAPEHIAPQVIDAPVSLLDVAPTLLDLAGLEALPQADGHSLRGLMEGGQAPEREGIGSSLVRFTWTPGAPEQYAWVSNEGVKTWDNGTRTLDMDLAQDPCESRSASKATTALETWRAQQDKAAQAFEAAYGQGAGALDQGELELLRALGYVE